MERRVGQVGEAVGGGVGGATQRRAHLLGGRDGGDGPLPGQQGGQEGRLGRGGASGRGRGVEGGWSRRRWRRGGRGGRGLRPVSPILRHGDGLERRSMGDGGKLSGGAMEEEERKKNDGVKMSESVVGVQSAECASDARTRGRSDLPDVQQNMLCIYLLR